MALAGGMGAMPPLATPPLVGGMANGTALPGAGSLIQPTPPQNGFVDATSGINSIARNIAAGFSKDPARRQVAAQQLAQEDAQRQQELQQLRAQQMHYMDQMTELAANGGWTPGIQKHTQAASASIDQLFGPGTAQQWQGMLAAADQSFQANKKQQEGFSLGEGQTRFDAQGNPVASVAAKSDVLSPEAEAQKMRLAVAGRTPAQPREAPAIGVINLKMADGTLRSFTNRDQTGIQDALSKGATEVPASALDQKTPDANPLRSQFNQLAAPYNTVKRNADIIMNSEDSPQGDVALIYSYVHVLDPTASVQQGDFLNATNTPGISEQIRNALNRAIENKTLTPEQRASYRSQTSKIMDTMQKEHDKLTKQYGDIAKATGIPEDQLFGEKPADVSAGSSQEQPMGQTSPEDAAKLPSGTWFTTTDGRVVQRK